VAPAWHTAADVLWSGGADGPEWSDSGNWAGGLAPANPAGVLSFLNAGSGTIGSTTGVINARRTVIISARREPYTLRAGDTIAISANGGAPQVVAFHPAQPAADGETAFANIAAATADEVARTINAARPGVAASAWHGRLVLRSTVDDAPYGQEQDGSPPKPNPFYAIKQRNYIVTAWREPIASACYPDVNNDGKPDVAVLEDPSPNAVVKIYLNNGGTFAEQPSITMPLPGMRVKTPGENKFRWGFLNDDKIPDLFPCAEMKIGILMSRNGKPEYDVTMFETPRPTFAVPADLDNDGLNDLVVSHRFVSAWSVVRQSAPGKLHPPRDQQVATSYFDTQVIDVNKDGKDDLVLSDGEVFLRQADGSFAKEPASKMQTVDVWRWGWAADFNNDGWVEVVQVFN